MFFQVQQLKPTSHAKEWGAGVHTDPLEAEKRR